MEVLNKQSNMLFFSTKTKKLGFTLVELLVVISIIALLMGIILPALGRAREASKAIVCASRMKQISVSFMNYGVDNNDEIIAATKVMTAQGTPWIWALLPYIDGDSQKADTWDKPADLWFCPSDKNPYPSAYAPHGQEYTSYALNGYYQQATAGSGWVQATPRVSLGAAGGYRFSQIAQQSECMLMVETSYFGQIYDAENPKVASLRLDKDGHHRYTSGFYHNNSMNLMFVDGHVSSIRGKSADPVEAPGSIKTKGHQFWNNISLPDSTENRALWGPGY